MKQQITYKCPTRFSRYICATLMNTIQIYFKSITKFKLVFFKSLYICFTHYYVYILEIISITHLEKYFVYRKHLKKSGIKFLYYKLKGACK